MLGGLHLNDLAGVALTLGAVMAASLFAGLALTPLASRLCWRFGLLDRPRPGELQREPTPRAGGYAMIGAFLVGVTVSLVIIPRSAEDNARLFGLLSGLLLVVPLALIDDLRRLPPKPQLIGQILIACVPIAWGITIDNVSSPFGSLIYLAPTVAVPLTLFWIVGMINTINFVDTMDGVAAGVVAIAAIVLCLRSLDQGQLTVAVLALALAAACLGFLPFNFNPARVFMGSGGSYFLGYTLAVLAIIGGAKIATALMVMGLPILDVAVVIVRRLLARRSPFKGGDGAHLIHRLHARGLPTRRIVLLLYAFSGASGLLALSLPGIQKLYLFAVIAMGTLATLAVLAYRARISKVPQVQRTTK